MGWLSGILDWFLGWFTSSEAKMVKAVRDATRSMCGFLPTVETVLALIAVNNPAVTTATMIARKICQAVTAQPVGLMATPKPPIIVDGVVIEGEFVNPDGE